MIRRWVLKFFVVRAVLWAAALTSPPVYKFLSKVPEIELIALADIATHVLYWIWKKVRNAINAKADLSQ